jgi:predicted nucleic acid-binding protein
MDQDITAGEIRLVELEPRVETEFNAIMAKCYREKPPLHIRTFDALHLASARASGETQVVATDQRLRDAAKLLGFSLFPV